MSECGFTTPGAREGTRYYIISRYQMNEGNMQLKGATDLELRLYNLCRECEETMPASEFETRLVIALSDAANELQELRGANVEEPLPFAGIEEALEFLAWCTNVAPGIADSVPPMSDWDRHRLAWAKLMVCGIRSDR